MEEYLMHHGIKGQKWGVRRFQNSDGSLTAEGQKRYYDSGEKKSLRTRRLEKRISSLDRDIHSFDPIRRTGVKDPRNGRPLLTKEDVSKSVASLRAQKNAANQKLKYSQKYDKADKYGRAVLRSQKHDASTMALREKNRTRYENSLNKKVSKGKISKLDANKKLSDFDNATASVAAGMKKYNKVIQDYAKMKAKAANDPSFKKNQKYKDAAKAYMAQKFSDEFSYGGSDYTKLVYATDDLKQRGG